MRKIIGVTALIIGCVILILLWRIAFHSFPALPETMNVGTSSKLGCEILYGELTMEVFGNTAKDKSYTVEDMPASVKAKCAKMSKDLVLCNKDKVYIAYIDTIDNRKMISELADNKIQWPGDINTNNSIILEYTETKW